LPRAARWDRASVIREGDPDVVSSQIPLRGEDSVAGIVERAVAIKAPCKTNWGI
jgi:hypothetical protein